MDLVPPRSRGSLLLTLEAPICEPVKMILEDLSQWRAHQVHDGKPLELLLLEVCGQVQKVEESAEALLFQQRQELAAVVAGGDVLEKNCGLVLGLWHLLRLGLVLPPARLRQ